MVDENQDGSRWLNCLIEGENDIFQVVVEIKKKVMHLKKAIRVENKLEDSIRNVELVLGKVDIDLKNHDEHSLSKIRLGDVGKLLSWERISHHWPDQPPDDHLHIIVKVSVVSPVRLFKRPRLDKSPPHTPPPKIQAGAVEAKYSPPYLDRQQTEIKIANALAGFEKYFEYLATGELDGRLDSIRPEDKLKKFGVVLPINPILLLHDLGKHTDQERIEELFKPDRYGICTITHLFNVSGSGKTRLLLDGLCSYWGLYISCRTEMGTASGSNDFTVATQQSMSSKDLSNNGAAARRVCAMLLCARVSILKQLVQHFPANTNIMDARRRWVLAQVLPPRLQRSEDLFVKVLRTLWNADTDIMLGMVRDLLGDIMTKRTNLFPEGKGTPLFVVIDEAQVAAEYLNFFPSTTGNGQRPILRGMVRFFQFSRIFNKIILSGTGLSMEMVEDARGSCSAKEVPSRVQGVFSNVGCFTREDPSQEAYIRRYLTLSDNNISDRRLLERMKYWFSGRYRLTASLIDIFLHSEDVPRHRVLTSFAERLTGFKITDAIELEAGEPPISSDLDKKIKRYRPLTELDRLFKEDELSNRMQLINCLTDALMRWTLGSELASISIENNMQEMIALGVGFLAKMPSILEDNVNVPVYISEPLVFLSLRSIFETQRWTTMKEPMTRSFRTALNSQEREPTL